MKIIIEIPEEQFLALRKALLSRPFQLLMGAEEWDLTEPEEMELWSFIHRLEGKS